MAGPGEDMFEFLARPLRSVLGIAERQVAAPLEETERKIVEAAGAIQRATESIERHVEVVEGLATSVGPLTESVNRLTETMANLVTILGPLAAAEHEVQRAERLFGLRRRRKTTEAPAD
jgi:hypothetical protein